MAAQQQSNRYSYALKHLSVLQLPLCILRGKVLILDLQEKLAHLPQAAMQMQAQSVHQHSDLHLTLLPAFPLP